MNQQPNTHLLVNEFTYHEPATLVEASELLLAHDAQVIAGGTDTLVHMKMERGAPQHLVSLRRIRGLSGIRAGEEVTIGAMTPIASIARHAFVLTHFAALAEACDAFSTMQVATMGTLGGNIANASPAADTAPALIAYGAQVAIFGPRGERCLPIADFFLAPGRSALARGEIVTAVMLPRPLAEPQGLFRPSVGAAFLKMGRVAADIAKASAAVVLVREGDRIASAAGAKLAFGAVGPVPLSAPRAEALLCGQRYSAELAAQAAAQAGKEVSPIDDVRSSAWYRREIVRVMVLDGLQRAWQRAGQAPPRWIAFDAPAEVPSRAASMTLAADQQAPVTLHVNGRTHRVWVGPNELLLNVLREKLQLTGSKYGCGIGECSACTVLMDGKPVLACLVLAIAAEGHEIHTVEGLQAADGTLDPLQEAFIDLAAYQCGYCTPGMLMTAKSLLAENPHPTEDQVRHYLRGNLCRCTGYVSITRAVLAATGSAPETIVR